MPSGLRPPPPPRSEFSEAASWTAWSAEISVTEPPNRIRAMISSCGRPAIGGEGDLRIVGAARDVDVDGDVLDVGAGDEVDPRIGRPGAGEGDMAAGDVEALAREAVGAADQLGLADDRRSRGRALDPKVGAPFGFEAHAGDEQAVVGAQPEVELPDARRGVRPAGWRRRPSAAARPCGERRRARPPGRRPGG